MTQCLKLKIFSSFYCNSFHNRGFATRSNIKHGAINVKQLLTELRTTTTTENPLACTRNTHCHIQKNRILIQNFKNVPPTPFRPQMTLLEQTQLLPLVRSAFLRLQSCNMEKSNSLILRTTLSYLKLAFSKTDMSVILK